MPEEPALRLEMTNYAATQVGASWTFPRIRQEERFQRYYDNYLAELFGQTPRSTNGLIGLIDSKDGKVHIEDIIRLNWFRIITDFYTQGYFGDRPALTSSDEARQQWIKDNQAEMFRALKLASRWYSIKGRLVILTQSVYPRVMAIDPTAYWPIRYEYSLEHTRAHLLAYRYYERGPTENYLVQRIPNRMKFVLYDPDNNMNEIHQHVFSGFQVGPEISREPGGVTGIFAIGRGDSDYSPVESPIRELMVRRSTDLKVLADNSNPFIVAPNVPPAESAMLRKQGLPARGGILFRDAQGFGWEYLEYAGQLKASLEITQSLKTQIYTLASIPPTAFGEVLEGDESGVAIGRLMHAALTKVKEVRLELESLIPEIMDGMGAPPGDTAIKWVADPWASEAERTASVLALLHAGVITPQRAAEQLGYDPDEITQMLEQQASEFDPEKAAKSVKPEYNKPGSQGLGTSPGRPPDNVKQVKDSKKK